MSLNQKRLFIHSKCKLVLTESRTRLPRSQHLVMNEARVTVTV